MQRKEEKIFLGHSSVYLLDFSFQDLGMSRISLNNNWTLKLTQKASELINLLELYLN